MIYVDDWQQRARVGRLDAVWSHLTAGPFDDLDELHELAQRIGMRPAWFQGKPWPRAHYDVTEPKRQEAIRAGAVPITWRQAGEQMVRAVEAWQVASGGQRRPRAPGGKPPGLDGLWAEAAELYELAAIRAAQPKPGAVTATAP